MGFFNPVTTIIIFFPLSVDDFLRFIFALGKPTSRMLKVDSLHYTGDRGGGGGYSREFLVAACRPVLRILTIFQTKYTRFQT